MTAATEYHFAFNSAQRPGSGCPVLLLPHLLFYSSARAKNLQRSLNFLLRATLWEEWIDVIVPSVVIRGIVIFFNEERP
jgi:hypothetical protein